MDRDEGVGDFDALEDPRSTINQNHPLVSVVVSAVMAVRAGAGGPTAIAQWARMNADFRVKALDLPPGIPGPDVFRRVLLLLQPGAVQHGFARWLQWRRDQAAAATGVDQPMLAVDGKTARRSHERQKNLGAGPAVSVWAGAFGLSLGPVACAEKSQELSALPELWRRVDMPGTIITLDALGTQKALAAPLVAANADSVLAVKGNQETLHQAVIDDGEDQSKNDFANGPARRHLTRDPGQGRDEMRSYIPMPVPDTWREVARWTGRPAIGRATLCWTRAGKEPTATRSDISSLPVGVKAFAQAIRSPGAIETSCHGSLAMTDRADASRIREPHRRENVAWLNRFTLSRLKQQAGKDSIAMKRRACGCSHEFLAEVLRGATV